MTAPYAPGHALAWITADPDGIRVHRAIVRAIEPTNPGYWRLRTDHGTTTVDHAGEAVNAVPLDAEIEIELYLQGDGYLVHPTVIEHDRAVEPDAGHQLDPGHDWDDDLGVD